VQRVLLDQRVKVLPVHRGLLDTRVLPEIWGLPVLLDKMEYRGILDPPV